MIIFYIIRAFVYYFDVLRVQLKREFAEETGDYYYTDFCYNTLPWATHTRALLSGVGRNSVL